MSLTQSEYDILIKLAKEFTDIAELANDQRWSRDLVSHETGDTFILDFYRGTIEFKKYSFNKRFRKVVVLLRYCSQGRHTNPDGEKFDGAHLHLYRDGYDDKFAFPVKELGINKTATAEEVLDKILSYCNVRNRPSIKTPLF